MNSNNLELSLIENEIEKISSKYHLRNGGAQLQAIPESHAEGIVASMKSPSVVSFGGGSFQQQNALQELTLNKQGKIPQKDQKGVNNSASNIPKVNPKDLSNEELEYIIKTGKLPQKFNNTTQQQQPQTQYSNLQQQQLNYPSQQQQQPSFQQKIDSLNKTSNSHSQLQNYIANPSIQNTFQTDNNDYIQDKHCYSPRTMNDFFAQKQPVNQFSQPVMLPQQHSFQLDNSYSKQFDQSQLNQSTSQAASHALKALQDKVKHYENQNQLLEDKLQITESQCQDTIKKLQSKLKEESEKAHTREVQIKEELAILKKQIETVECEKLRHLEENSNEREHWRVQNKRVEEENLQLKRQMQEQIQRYSNIEETIQDIKRREAFLRERYEKELQGERDKSKSMMDDLDQTRTRYEELKNKIREKNKRLEDENRELKSEITLLGDTKSREIQRLTRECEKWKRESQMLKEEVSILGDRQGNKENKGLKGQQKHKKQQEGLQSASEYSNVRGTPKQQCENIKLNCYSPAQKEDKQPINSSRNFQSIDSQEKPKKSKRQKSQHKSDAKHKKNTSQQQQSSLVASSKENTFTDSNKQHDSDRKPRLQSSSNRNKFSQKKHSSHSKHSTKEERTLKTSQVRSNMLSSSKNTKRQTPSSKKQKKIMSERSLNGVQSQQNLISINTKSGKAETIGIDNTKKEASDYILVDTLNQQRTNYSASKDSNSKFNQYKRTSVESSSNQFALSQTSEFGNNLIYSHQSSIDHRGLDLNDFHHSTNNNDRQVIDNEIFYLEREIFDYNQQYKTLLTQQTNTNSSYSAGSNEGANLNQRLRTIAQQLEEKSERLFDLKKQQQQILMKETFKEKNPFLGESNGYTKSYSYQ